MDILQKVPSAAWHPVKDGRATESWECFFLELNTCFDASYLAPPPNVC